MYLDSSFCNEFSQPHTPFSLFVCKGDNLDSIFFILLFLAFSYQISPQRTGLHVVIWSMLEGSNNPGASDIFFSFFLNRNKSSMNVLSILWCLRGRIVVDPPPNDSDVSRIDRSQVCGEFPEQLLTFPYQDGSRKEIGRHKLMRVTQTPIFT